MNKTKQNKGEISKTEFDVLFELFNKPFINQRNLSESTGYSLGLINRSLRHLCDYGYINSNIGLTDKSKTLFEFNKPKNAIILAAGFGMRMIPINMATPKALIEVNGEKLIDRLINQLHEVNIKDITVVVGFMKDSFEYLIDEYGVNLSYAASYAITNNMYSLATVADKINNTYIIPCDIWCEKNLFKENELYSWYMVSDAVDTTSNVRVNRKMELVKVSKKNNGNRMTGVSYLTGNEAKLVSSRIKALKNDNNYNGVFWEESLYSGNRMIVKAKVINDKDVVEINTFEQVKELDSSSNQLKSEALQVIVNNLHCSIDDIVDINDLKKGMTNRSFSFRIKQGENIGKYIMRIPGEGTDQLVDRMAEAIVYEKIKDRGFCDNPVYIDPTVGYKITRYIEGARCCDPKNESDIKQCMRKLRSFHDYRESGYPLTVSHTFDILERIDFYENLWNGKPSVYRDYLKTKENCKKLVPFVEKHRGEMQLAHIDAVPDNFLFENNGNLQLTDWEYAGMQDKHIDLAMFCIYAMYNKEQTDHLIDLYFEGEGGCDKITKAKIYCYVSLCGLVWSNWCEYKRNLGVEFGEYSLCQYRYSKEFYKYAIELMAEIGEPIEKEVKIDKG